MLLLLLFANWCVGVLWCVPFIIYYSTIACIAVGTWEPNDRRSAGTRQPRLTLARPKFLDLGRWGVFTWMHAGSQLGRRYNIRNKWQHVPILYLFFTRSTMYLFHLQCLVMYPSSRRILLTKHDAAVSSFVEACSVMCHDVMRLSSLLILCIASITCTLLPQSSSTKTSLQ